MVVSRAALVLICFVAALPALIKVGLGWKARLAPLKVAVDAVLALNLLMFVLAMLLPLSRVAAAALIAVGVLLGSLDIFTSGRSWRRSKAAATPPNE
jgi:hypothetical protein